MSAKSWSSVFLAVCLGACTTVPPRHYGTVYTQAEAAPSGYCTWEEGRRAGELLESYRQICRGVRQTVFFQGYAAGLERARRQVEQDIRGCERRGFAKAAELLNVADETARKPAEDAIRELQSELKALYARQAEIDRLSGQYAAYGTAQPAVKQARNPATDLAGEIFLAILEIGVEIVFEVLFDALFESLAE